MPTFGELFGVLACIMPIIALVAYMAWATRLPRCPHCNHPRPADNGPCEHCGAESDSSVS